jgi:hypothetical protein
VVLTDAVDRPILRAMPTTALDLLLLAGAAVSLGVSAVAGFYIAKGRLPEWPVLNGIQRRLDAMDV